MPSIVQRHDAVHASGRAAFVLYTKYCPMFHVHALLVQMSVILLNLVTGPPLFRAAIVAVGEARALQLPSLAGDVFDDVPFQRTPSMPKTASKCAFDCRV